MCIKISHFSAGLDGIRDFCFQIGSRLVFFLWWYTTFFLLFCHFLLIFLLPNDLGAANRTLKLLRHDFWAVISDDIVSILGQFFHQFFLVASLAHDFFLVWIKRRPGWRKVSVTEAALIYLRRFIILFSPANSGDTLLQAKKIRHITSLHRVHSRWNKSCSTFYVIMLFSELIAVTDFRKCCHEQIFGKMFDSFFMKLYKYFSI